MRYFTILLISVFTVSLSPPDSDYLLPVNSSEIDFKSPLHIANQEAAYQLGKLSFHIPASAHGSCASCHKIQNGGYSLEPLPVGNAGIFDIMYKDVNPSHRIDLPDLKTPAVVNVCFSENALSGAELGSSGFNSEVDRQLLSDFKNQNDKGFDGVFTQVDVGFDAHDISTIVALLKDLQGIDSLCNIAFGEEVSELSIISAIGIYEKSIVANEAPLQKFLRGEIDELYSPKGFELFKSKCANCHAPPALGFTLSQKIGESDFAGRFRMTKDSLDIGVLKTPGLYNVWQSPAMFHNAEEITVYQAIKRHDLGLTPKELRALRSFIRFDLTDPNLKRYLK